MRRVAALVLSLLLVSGCSGDSSEPSAEPTASTNSPDIPSATASSEPTEATESNESAEKPSNARALRDGTSILEASGVRNVMELEPPHGSSAASLGGVWRGRDVVVGVTRTGALDRSTYYVERAVDVAGTSIEVVGLKLTSTRHLNVQFSLFGYRWLINVHDSAGAPDIQASVNLARWMLKQFGCVSECPDAPSDG